jgi:hypothetical protein
MSGIGAISGGTTQTIMIKPPAGAPPGPPPHTKPSVDSDGDNDNNSGSTGKLVNLSA